jgi:truncated hemoglobin YjbI
MPKKVGSRRWRREFYGLQKRGRKPLTEPERRAARRMRKRRYLAKHPEARDKWMAHFAPVRREIRVEQMRRSETKRRRTQIAMFGEGR